MNGPGTLQYRVEVSKDPETGSVVAEVPALGIADYGADTPEALTNIKAMVAFHLECLQEEGKPIPAEELTPRLLPAGAAVQLDQGTGMGGTI